MNGRAFGWFDARAAVASPLHACLAGLLGALRGEQPVWPAQPEPEGLADLICAHRLQGVLLNALSTPGSAPPENRLPLLSRLAGETTRQRARWVMLNQAACEVAQALQAADVPAVFLKGFAYASILYPSPELRPFNDLDLLVPEAALNAAGTALEKAGYRPSDQPLPPGPIEKSFYKPVAPGVTVDVDLHWKLVGPRSLNRGMCLDPQAFLARSADTGGGMFFLNRTDALLFAAVNLVVHGYSPLQQFYDLKLLVEQPLDTTEVLERAQACRVRAALGAGLAIADGLFGARVPEPLARGLQPAAWQTGCFKRWLKVADLLRIERFQEPAVRYGLKLASQDRLSTAMFTTLAMPFLRTM